ncbi:MAG: LPXTG cell wall anchor domain-containing protein [Microbacteriaceae bacterium]
MTSLARIALTAVFSALMALTASPSFAATNIEIGGDNPTGGVVWEVDAYGIAGSYDYSENYTSIYYPNWIDPGWDIEWCGTNGGNDVTVTNETNGDVTVDCDENLNAFNDGVSTTMHIRFYAESETGYLARQWIEITNSNDVDENITEPLHLYYYWNYYGWNDGDNWLTSQGGVNGADGDTWGAGNDLGGLEIATTSAWAASCSTETFVADSGYDFPASLDTIEANSTLNIVTFFNMNFPTEASADGSAAAFDVAVAQAAEFSELSGRLDEGLPGDTIFFGWNDGACASEPTVLPNTGASIDTVGTATLAGAAITVGLAAVVIRRRRNS